MGRSRVAWNQRLLEKGRPAIHIVGEGRCGGAKWKVDGENRRKEEG
jgi:hypothetical protein